MPGKTLDEKKRAKLLKKAKLAEQREQKARNAQRAHLFREIEYGKLTTIILDRKWETILCKLESEHQKCLLTQLTQSFERLLDAKDFKISFLKDDLHLKSGMQMLIWRNHVANMDKLVEVYYQMMEDIDPHLDEYLQKKRQQEIDLLSHLYSLDDVKMQLEQMIAIRRKMEFDGSLRLVCVVNEFEAIKEQIKDYQEDKQNIFFDLYFETRDFLIGYYENNMKHIRAYGSLVHLESQERLSNERNATIMAQKRSKIERLKEKFHRIKEKKYFVLNKAQENVDFMKEYYHAFNHYLKKTKNRFTKDLELLSVCSNESLAWLEAILKKATNVLKGMDQCRRLEAEQEKVIGYPLMEPCIEESEHSHLTSADSFIPEERILDNRYVMLSKKMAVAQASLYELENERKYLLDANKGLQVLMAQYCQCLKVTKPSLNENSNPTVVCGNIHYEYYEKYTKGRTR